MTLRVWLSSDGYWTASARIGHVVLFRDASSRADASWYACHDAYRAWRVAQS